MTLDGVLGREAHISFLERSQLSFALALHLADVWDTSLFTKRGAGGEGEREARGRPASEQQRAGKKVARSSSLSSSSEDDSDLGDDDDDDDDDGGDDDDGSSSSMEGGSHSVSLYA